MRKLRLFLASVLFVPAVALADNPGTAGVTAYYGPSTGFAGVVGYLVGLINGAVWVLGSLAILLFMVQVVQYIVKPADKRKYKNMQWSLLALFVLFSVWGILRALCASYQGICG